MSSQSNLILIIEDSPVQAKIIRKQIEAYTSFVTHTANTLQEAEQVIAEHKEEIFLALVDLNLPDGPNGEAADLCLKWKVPSVVLTASFDENQRKGFLDRKVADFFFKGSIQDMDPLITSIERISRNRDVKVLVVDDSATIRAMVCKLLKVQLFHVIEAEDGVDALETLKKHPDVRLVVTDFEMPRMDGITLVREIRQLYRPEEMAVVGISAVGSGPLTARFLKNGANDFLTKPFEAEEFYWRINQTVTVQDMMRELGKRRPKPCEE